MKLFLIYCNTCKNPMIDGAPCYECEERAEKRAAVTAATVYSRGYCAYCGTFRDAGTCQCSMTRAEKNAAK